MAGLLPILWSSGAGSEVMRRIAAPMVGGMISSTVLTLIVIPALYALVKEASLRRAARSSIHRSEATDENTVGSQDSSPKSTLTIR